MKDRIALDSATVCVIGVGYVGLALAEAFSRSLAVVGLDIDKGKIKKLNDSNGNQNLVFTDNPEEIARADFIIICVPTPVTESKEPDLSYIKSAAAMVRDNMRKGSVVVLESTVYPGVTEEVVKPILEESGLTCGRDFRLAYSPERVNPGSTEHGIDKVTKVVSGMDEETVAVVAELYSRVAPAVFKARDIRTAEAAKVIENIQRDLNIALVNELTLIFEKMGLSVRDVLDTAATKWNFHRYSPGLVGGHCIPVDPYYLVHKARMVGYHPQVILAGRAINDYMPQHVARMALKALNETGKVIKGSRVLIMGMAYKEDVPDIRESQVKEMVKELQEYKVETFGFDPLVAIDIATAEFKSMKIIRNLDEVRALKVDAIIVTVAHSFFHALSFDDFKELQHDNPILIDVRGVFDAGLAAAAGFYYKTL